MAFLLNLSLTAALTVNPTPTATAPLQDTASTRKVANVTMPTTVDVGTSHLVLNGMALRKKMMFKVYVASLYLPAKSNNADEILAADAPRYMVMSFVRSVDKGKLCEAWEDGLEKNTPNAGEQLKADFKQLCDWMEDIKDGEQMVFTYLPEGGTTVGVRGTEKGVIAGKEFGDALFRCWIGPNPAPGQGFKKDLLGGQ
ncbi:MAG TPA: chalcone isomerase family protein [Gemmatimonadales bacterium]|nr:chalcone isomerase family protein [Gemmatimonadales bacterium]